MLETPDQLAQHINSARIITQSDLDRVVRSLAFAGIAIIWLFHENLGSEAVLPVSCKWPLVLFVVALASDLLGAVLAVWWFQRRTEFLLDLGMRNPFEEKLNALLTRTDALGARTFRPTTWLNWGSVSSLLAGYVLLGLALATRVHFG